MHGSYTSALLHFILATPGRIVDYLENTKGFNLRPLKFLVSL